MFIHFVQMHNKRKSVPVSGSGTKGETSPHSTKILPSGHRAQTKKEQLSPRKPLQALFFFVPGAARFFFSRKRKRNVGRNRSPPLSRGEKTPPRCGAQPFPLFQEEQNPAPLRGAKVLPSSKKGKNHSDSLLRAKKRRGPRLFVKIQSPGHPA